MLYPDILQLKQFYASRLGALVASLVTEALVRLWPTVEGESVLVVGFGVPYAEQYRTQASPVMLLMPAQQGALAWPVGRPNHVVLSHDGELPLQNNTINRVLLVHSAECSDHLHELMQEVWRVLVPGGKLLMLVPNRVSFWSGSARTPFGFGRPFNALQLRGLLGQHHFTVTRSSSALFAPPLVAQFAPGLAKKMERVGRLFWWFLGGLLFMESEKQLYASINEPVFVSKPYRVRMQAATLQSR